MDHEATTPLHAAPAGLDRRQLLRAGAWAAPAVAVAMAVPAASASVEGDRTIIFNNFLDYFTDDGAGHRNGLIVNGQISTPYDNSGPNYTGYPVGNVTLSAWLPAAWFSTSSVVTFYAGSDTRWTQVGSPVLQGSEVRFTFVSVAYLHTTDQLSTGNLTVGFSATGILPAGTGIHLRGLATAQYAKSLSGERDLTVP